MTLVRFYAEITTTVPKAVRFVGYWATNQLRKLETRNAERNREWVEVVERARVAYSS